MGIKTHETLLSMIPEGSEYVSLFSGALKTIVAVSHEKKEKEVS